MMHLDIKLPSKPKVVSETDRKGIYEIDGLSPGYGHTLGNSLRRIILSSMPGVALTLLKIEGVQHEFSTVPGVTEDVISIMLNLQKVRFSMTTDEPQTLSLVATGVGEVLAKDITVPGQVEVLDPKAVIAHVTEKNARLAIEMRLEKGLGFVPKEAHQKEKVEIGVIALDAPFTPIRRVSYEVENMRVGDRTDFNRLRLLIETDGVIAPRAALEKSIEIMIAQLQAIHGFRAEISEAAEKESAPAEAEEETPALAEGTEAAAKTKIEDLGFSSRTLNALSLAGIRTVGGLSRKKEEDLLEVSGLGDKGLKEIKRALSNFGMTLK